MTEELAMVLISSASGLIGAIVGAIASYIGAGKQIKYQRDQLKKEQFEQLEIAIGIIARFLWREIDYNCEILDGKAKMLSTDRFIKEYKEQFGLSSELIKFEEFNKVKYDLVKYKSGIVKDILDIYDKFYILSVRQDIKSLSDNEFKWVRDLYIVNERIRKKIMKDYNAFFKYPEP
jgi:hypothetical protein